MISKDDTIGDIVQNHPETIPIMIDRGLHCVGCHVAGQETLEQGCKGHGMDAAAITAMIKDMNTAVKAASKGPAVRVTDAAAKKLKEVMVEQKKPKALVRVMAMPSCHGLQYDLHFEEKKKEDDVIVKAKGITMLIDRISASLVRGATIDFIGQGDESGFSIKK